MRILIVFALIFGAGLAISGCTTGTKSDAAVVENLKRYAALMRETESNAWPPASVIDKGAEQLQQLYSGETKGSIYVGFNPSDELRKYAALLSNLGRVAEAKEMEALAQWYVERNIERFKRSL